MTNLNTRVLRTGTICTFALCLGLLWASVSTAQSIDQGLKLFQESRYELAKVEFERVLRSNPDDPRAHFFLGRIHLALGHVDESITMLEKAVKIDAENIDYHLWLAKAYGEKTRSVSFLFAGRWAGRWKAELERAHELDVNNIEARTQLINYLLNAPGIGGGDKKRGRRLAEETVGIDEIRGRLLLANALNATKEVESAIAEYEHVLKLDPENKRAYNSLGYMFLDRKDYDAAKSSFEMYVAVAPEDPNAYDCLGDYYLDRGDIIEAIARFREALDVDSTFAASRFKLAQAYEEREMRAEAIHHYEKFIELNPSNGRIKEAMKRLQVLKKKE